VWGSQTVETKKVTLKKLGVKRDLSSGTTPDLTKKSVTPMEEGMKKFDQSVKADGFSLSPNEDLLRSLYDNKGDVLKSLNDIDLTAPPINAEYKISF
jgi:hypothetical protein